MKLTIKNRIKICWEVLTIKRGHKHYVQEKELSLFKRGYDAGYKDGQEDFHTLPDEQIKAGIDFIMNTDLGGE